MRRLLLALATATALVSCDPDAPEPAKWREVPEPGNDPAMQERLGEAGAAAQQLGQALLSQLQRKISEGGPVAAIGFCNENAIPLTDDVNAKLAERFDGRLRIGRTSSRLRNPDNTPPSWAVDAVARGDSRRHVFEGPDGAMGFLLPITTGGLCLACHGTSDSIDPAVAAAISERYPNDQATGFAAGELRGYFWVESD